MRSFRAEYEDASFIEVIGYRQPLNLVWRGVNTIPAHRLMVFHESVILSYEGRRYETEPDSLVFLPAYRPVSYGRNDSDWTHSWLRFTGSPMADLFKRQGLEEGKPLAMETSGSWEPWLLGLHREMGRRPGPDMTILKGLLDIWARHIRLEIIQKKDAPSWERDVLEEARLRIDRDYLKDLSTAELADRAGMDESYFCALFRRRWGLSPLAYRLALRMEQARELLRETAFSIETVGELSGYADPYYFSRLFKRENGLSPRQFRLSRTN